MKKILCMMAALTVLATGLRADEGMWLLPLLQKMNAEALQQEGCRLTPDQIYSINHSSIKDAIVQFGGGCTGEIISNEGLLVTNHHCGYSSIQKLSSVEHDYLADGYWAMNRAEELPCDGLSVTFLEYMEDITDKVAAAEAKARKIYKDSLNVKALVMKYIQDNVSKPLIEKTEQENPHCHAHVMDFYNENAYYLIVYKTYTDIRFVGAPPSSIGKFGADTDNWMWPRHTGDFSMFRVYADKDNNPASYSPDNVPYTPKQALTISLKGIQEGDFAMIMGYPGSTVRFQTSPQLKLMLQTNDIRIAARTVRQDIMLEDMLADPKVKIQYASKYSGSTNGWKKWQGMKQAFAKLGIIERAEQEEAEFTQWVNAKKKRSEKYADALSMIESGCKGWAEPRMVQTAMSESMLRSELSSAGSSFNNTVRDILKADYGTDTLTAMKEAASMLETSFYKDYSLPTDIKITKAMMKYYRDNVDAAYYPAFDGGDLATMDIDSYVDRMFETSAFTSAEKLANCIETMTLDQLAHDPAIRYRQACIETVLSTYGESTEKALLQIDEGAKTYTAGLLEWKKDEPSYPDANFTMRLTYGTVKSYSPADAVIYRYYTTLDGVMQKEDPDNWEFVVPARLKELWENADFGEYALPDGKMPVAFLTDNDITGGNSGSPVMNADGQLIGLAFDGNWESMSSDVMFEPDLQRCICVDIRYVLFIMDKFGGAGYLLDEMNIAKN